MGAIHVEGIEEPTLKSIALRAERNGRSLDEEVRAILETAAGADEPSAEKPKKNWLEQLDEIRAMTKGYSPETDSTDIIRKLRDKARAEEPPPMSPEEFAAEAARIRAMTQKDAVQTDSTEIIRELRDHGYRRAARADRIRAMTKGSSPETDSVAIIREMRDRER